MMRISLQVPILMLAFWVMADAAGAAFSVDRGSPEVPGVSAADILGPGVISPAVVVPATIYGLGPGVPPCAALAGGECELDAMSNGFDAIIPAASPGFFAQVQYSVDRAAVGAGGSAIAVEATVPPGNGAAGDLFAIIIPSGGPPGAPFLFHDSVPLTLTPAPTVAGQSDLDAVSGFPSAMPTKISVDPSTAAALGVSPADILVLFAGGPPPVWASAAGLGLVAADDIDALAVNDLGIPGTFDAGDVIYVSLAPGSPSLAPGALFPGGASAGDVIQVFPTPAAIVISAATLGLAPTDNLNALSGYDPGPGGPGSPTDAPALGSRGIAILLAVLIGVGVVTTRLGSRAIRTV
jgi:hypothetical protein